MKRGALLASVVLLASAGCQHKQATTDPAEAQMSGPQTSSVSFRTDDGWTITGNYQSPPGAKRAVLLLHQRDGRARDWALLVARLAEDRIATLAIDQRGAGRSKRDDMPGEAPWDTSGDIAGAVKWLGSKGFTPERVGLVGASYGANNALLYAANTPSVPAIALLSPGKDYHGLAIEKAANTYQGPMMLVYCRDDSVTKGGPDLIAKAREARNLVTDSASYDGDTHGTYIFSRESGSVTMVAQFLASRLPSR